MEVRCDSCGTNTNLKPDHASLSLRCEACGKMIDLTKIAETLIMDGGLSLADHLNATVVSPASVPAAEGNPVNYSERAKATADSTQDNMLGGYRLERELDRTPLGTLYRGEQVTLRRPVYIFILNEELAAEDECANTFINEARRSASLMHPHLARVYDIGVEGKVHYVVSEFIKEDSVEKNLLKGQRFSSDSVIHIGIEIARGLAVAHSTQMLHWGLSPKNIFVTAQGDVRLTHFGISHALFVGEQAGQRIGVSDYFFAPKNLLSELSPQIDFFALGGILYYMLTGSLPKCDSTESQDGDSLKTLTLPELENPDLKIPQNLIGLLRRIFSSDPDERPASASDLAQALDCIRLEKAVVEPPVILARPALGTFDKRRYKRFRTDMAMKISQADISKEKQEVYIAKLENLSENGAYILTDSPLPMGSFVNLNFEMKAGASSRVEALGIVRWSDETPGNIGMGVQFLEVSTNNRRNLNDYVDRQTASDMVREIASSALHKSIIRVLSQNWDKTIQIEQIMRSTGASRVLFDRTLSDFEKNGLVKRMGNKLCCIRPISESVENAIEELLRTSH